MRVEKKNILHKIVRPLLNYWGRVHGISGCGICGDTWNWKKSHDIDYKKNRSAFPICEECWQTAPAHLIEQATHELARTWILQSPPKHLKQILEDTKLLKAACRKELAFNRGKTKNG